MKLLQQEVLRLIANNSMHHKGVRINDKTIAQIFNHAHGELCELYNAITDNEPEIDQKKEMGDILGIIIHIITKQGWSLEELETIAIDKLRQRFN